MKTPKVAIIVLAILAGFLFWLARNPASMLSITGRGGDVSNVSENIDVALEETRYRAASGDLESQYDLAAQLVMLDMTGTSPGFKEAEIWFRKAAAQGHLQAQAFLCNVYYRGVAVPRVPTETFRWCQGAAEAGNRLSQFWLGSIYESGEGIPQDYARARFWYTLAASGFDDNPAGKGLRERLDHVESIMTEEQIAESESMLQAWTSGSEDLAEVLQ
ncbi:MAG: tetratricopeptide repeat protein [Thermoanaerobaculia bacterium]